jgi:putative ABC transport system permease protein
MLFSYIKITLRTFFKNKISTFINLLGFSAGIVTAFLIFVYVSFELSYDEYHEDVDLKYRVNMHLELDGEPKAVTVTPNILGPRLLEEVPGVENYVRLSKSLNTTATVIVEDEKYKEADYYVADSSVFDFFAIDMLLGSKAGNLTKPEHAIISVSKAMQYYGSTDVIGKNFSNSEGRNYTVTGVYKDIAENSHLRPSIIVSSLSSRMVKDLKWDNANYFTYIKFRPDANIQSVEKKLADMLDKEGPDWMKTMKTGFSFIPIKEIHLNSTTEFEPSPGGDKNQIMGMIIIAIFILVIACVNYINLATSRSLERAREVGLRKMMGSVRTQLITQFLFESFVTTFLSVLFAIVILTLAEPYFVRIIGKNISVFEFFTLANLTKVTLTWLIISILSGLYPSFILTSYLPSNVLKGSFKKSKGGAIARKSLVIFQFVLSTCLIIGTFIIYKQVKYLGEKKLGFDKEHVMAVSLTVIPDQHDLASLKKNLVQHSNIQQVSFCSAYPSRNSGGQIINAEGMAEDENMLMWEWRSEEDILEAFGVNLISGKNFNQTRENAEEREYIINETAMEMIGWDEESAIGKRITMGYDKGTCIGVVEDFHFNSLKTEVEPMTFVLKSGFRNHVILRLGEGDITATLAFIKKEWGKSVPDLAFDYHFVDESFDALYKNEYKTGQLFVGFSILTIIIASLGLFGLSTYETQVRTKEIGIRKALGSSSLQIFKLLVNSFTLLVFAGFVISIPIAIYALNYWLQSFAYKTSIGVMEFIYAGIITFMIVIISVGFQAIKAAINNPVESLRYE